jgi:hypothetical protein
MDLNLSHYNRDVSPLKLDENKNAQINTLLERCSSVESKKLNEELLIRLVSSERHTKDVETVMNSTYWIEALKNSYAKGVGKQLNCNLKLILFFFNINKI